MIHIHAFYRADNSEMLHKFYEEAAAAGVIEASRNDAGNVKYDYYFSAERENEILLVEKWETREHLQAHCTMPQMATLAKLKEKYNIQTELEEL